MFRSRRSIDNGLHRFLYAFIWLQFGVFGGGIFSGFWGSFAVVLSFCLFIEKELNIGWVSQKQGEDLEALRGRTNMIKNVPKYKNCFEQ